MVHGDDLTVLKCVIDVNILKETSSTDVKFVAKRFSSQVTYITGQFMGADHVNEAAIAAKGYQSMYNDGSAKLQLANRDVKR
jgi:hypothetical protein